MRLGRCDGPGAYRCGYTGEDAAWHDGLSGAGDSAWMGRVEEDIAGSWHDNLDVGEPDDQETIEQDEAEMEMGAGHATYPMAI